MKLDLVIFTCMVTLWMKTNSKSVNVMRQSPDHSTAYESSYLSGFGFYKQADTQNHVSNKHVPKGMHMPGDVDEDSTAEGFHTNFIDYPFIMKRRFKTVSIVPKIQPDNKYFHVKEPTSQSKALSFEIPFAKSSVFSLNKPNLQSFPFHISEMACPIHHDFLKLLFAEDRRNQKVQIWQPDGQYVGTPDYEYQWFYVRTCWNHHNRDHRACDNCCIGIDSSRYQSQCVQEITYMEAYVKRISDGWQTDIPSSNEEYYWDKIKVNASCDCKIAPLH